MVVRLSVSGSNSWLNSKREHPYCFSSASKRGDWDSAVEDQASDRTYRIGQTRPVTIYRLIAKGTIEEKIIRLHHTKKDLADSLLEGTDLSHKLTREEILELLGRSRS